MSRTKEGRRSLGRKTILRRVYIVHGWWLIAPNGELRLIRLKQCHRRVHQCRGALHHLRMISLALPLVLLSWLLIHFIHRFYIPTDRSRGILPTSLTNRKRFSTTITLKTLHLRVESTAFNFHHDVLSHRLTRSPTARLPTVLRVAFDLGIVISLLGMVVALAMLSWTFILLARRLMADLFPPSPDIHTHVKRAYQNDYITPTLPARAPADIPVQLLVRLDYLARIIPTHSSQIPGVTLPLSHLPILIGALFFSQAIHEAGHALSAALSVVLLTRPVLR